MTRPCHKIEVQERELETDEVIHEDIQLSGQNTMTK